MADTKFNLIADGAQDFLGGQDASKIPDRIADNCYASGINVSVKRGSLAPRWGFVRQPITFPEGFIYDPFQRRHYYKEIFESGKFQMAAPYFIGATQYILIVVAGVIFLYNPDTGNLNFIEIEGGTKLNSRARRLNWSAAGQYLIIYDFPAYPVIISGLTARRADPAALEIPAATIGAYNENRLFVANNGNEFTGGDPVGNILTTNAPLSFEEVFTTGSPYLNQFFQLPTSSHNDPITFMGFLQLTDTSTGIGPLIIATNRAVYSYNTQNSRDTWDQSQFGSLVCYDAGVVGPRAWANVNSDAFFLSSDGYVRSLSMSRNQQKTWARVPLSREVENWFKIWDKSLLELGFVSSFMNKVFFSVNPYRIEAVDFATYRPISDYAHGGMVVLELDNLTSFGEATKPVWAGLWTGVNPMEMVNLGDRAFIISKDSSRINRIYQIDPTITYDVSGEHIRPVRSRIYTKEHDFKDSFENKEIHSIDFNLDALQGDFKIDIQYKAGHSPRMYPWRTFTHKAPWRTCGMPDGCFLNGFLPHFIRDFTLGAPEADTCSPITNDFYKVFRKIQLQFTLEGKYWEVHEYRVKAMPRPKSEIQTICEELPKIAICEDCNDDWLVGEFESCLQLVT